MNWALAIVLAYILLAVLINFARIGKVRVKTPFEAICDAIELILLCACVIWAVNW
jgi:hypothetical protein